jgi:hypothetical protein
MGAAKLAATATFAFSACTIAGKSKAVKAKEANIFMAAFNVIIAIHNWNSDNATGNYFV